MINRNAYHNAMRCGTLLSTPRPDAQHRATRLYSTQRFVCFITPLLGLPLRPSTLLNAAICLLSAQLSYANRTSTQCNVTPLCSTIRLFTPLLNSALLSASNGSSTQLNDLFITTRRIDTRLSAPQLSATICLLSTHRFSSPRPSTPLNDLFFINAATMRNSTRRHAPQRNDLFFINAPN